MKELANTLKKPIINVMLVTNRDSDNVGDQIIEACDVQLISTIMKKFEVILYGFTPRSANQPASDKQLCYAYDLAERQGLDAEALCSINFHKEYSDMTANEASQLIDLLT